jgi:hypothetical protein
MREREVAKRWLEIMIPHQTQRFLAGAALIVVLLAALGCGGDAVYQGPAVENPVLLDPDDPESIARWESSPYNFGNCRIRVERLRHFHGALGDSSVTQPRSVALHVYEANAKGVAPEQRAAIDRLVQEESSIHAAVREAIYGYYKESYAAYKHGLSVGAALCGGAESRSARCTCVGSEQACAIWAISVPAPGFYK